MLLTRHGTWQTWCVSNKCCFLLPGLLQDATYRGLHTLQRNLDATYVVLDPDNSELRVRTVVTASNLPCPLNLGRCWDKILRVRA